MVFQPADNTSGLSISGNAISLTGEIYAPAAQLNESGNGQLNASIVVDTMAISGNGITDAVVLSAGSAVAPLLSSGLVNPESSDSGGNQVVGVFDSLSVTSTTNDVRQPRQSLVADPNQGSVRRTPASQGTEISAVDQILGELQDDASHGVFIGDLALEQLSDAKPRAK